ncbi:hypothetical protein PC116_g26192 [Phytophthora cactorum]|uniref:Uncharacterized protein n=1 Tax=Phytophthora cactorum TaxID=29920 RepID=A0A8T1CQ11_9STRA|nr:hypothetical protein PC114_g24405 [Phytophthora cactorum]KAG2924969.1 hypothetical protein PC117_g15261 [Phytophthora cactorum]KAG2969394.1 hypothetical protein PC119_g23928 [Phytophthora cactorum]KAG3128365.1 hypothetical protein C6341_g24585 [Phytophthora cactorum]KAG4225377.1 hypothetical protein PC116_g26192 [Phytophthora cactorum]
MSIEADRQFFRVDRPIDILGLPDRVLSYDSATSRRPQSMVGFPIATTLIQMQRQTLRAH